MRFQKGPAALALALALTSGAARAEGESITVEQAVARVEQDNPRVLQLLALARSGKDVARSSLGRMLPSFHVNEEYQLWNSAFTIPFGTTLFPVRDQNTNTLSVSADQPILGLLRLSHDHDADALRAEASEAELLVAHAELKAMLATQFLRLYEARALEDIAKTSERELGEQVAVTQARLSAGVLTTADLLRVQVAVANAKQQEIVAHTQGEVARATLLGAVGVPQGDARTVFVEPRELIERSHGPAPNLADAERRAVEGRPELLQKGLEVEAARHAAKARLFSLLPDVDLEGAYLRTDGSVFNPPNAAFFGVKATWAIFEFGASYYLQRAAAEQTEAKRQDAAYEQRVVGVEVARDLSQARASAAAVDVAEQTIASAEEAYRVTQALLKAGAATTTDLLDSEGALTQARLNLTRARYEQAIAVVALDRSVGAR